MIGKTGKLAILMGSLMLTVCVARGQDIAEAGALTSHSTMAANTLKVPTTNTPTPVTQGSSPHLLARTGPPVDEVNRKDFEDNAGEKAGKMLLRSVPTGAEIFVNNLLVGRAPLLMVVAPGKYEISMRGSRDATGRGIVGVMPKETQTVVINLTQKYPNSIKMR